MFRSNLYTAVFLSVAVMLACSCGVTPQTPKTDGAKPVIQNMADTFTVDFENVIFDVTNRFFLELDSVVSDSRCPEGAQCVWEGNAEVRFRVKTDTSAEQYFSLNTNSRFTTDTTLNNINFKLIKVSPYPKSDEKTSYYDYRVAMVVRQEKSQ